MIVVVTATEMERAPVELHFQHRGFLGQDLAVETVVCGVGVLETAVRLSTALTRLGQSGQKLDAVVHCGVAGAYLQPETPHVETSLAAQPRLLDLCLARSEVFGDFGVDLGDGFLRLDKHIAGESRFIMDESLLQRAEEVLAAAGHKVWTGNFVTVAATSGTRARGELLRREWDGLCENMEGAAVARVCEAFGVPCLELRAVSNYVEDRNLAGWRLQEAADVTGKAVVRILEGLSNG